MDSNTDARSAVDQNSQPDTLPKQKNKYLESAFMFGVAGMSILFGFGRSFANAKKQDPVIPENPHNALKLQLEGSALARRALGWGTLYAFTGVGLITFGIWKLVGADTFQEFRTKVGGILPKITNENSKERTEFESLTEFMQYLIDEDVRAKKSTTSSNSSQKDDS